MLLWNSIDGAIANFILSNARWSPPLQTNTPVNVQFSSFSASNIRKWKNRMKRITWKNRMKWITVSKYRIGVIKAPLKLQFCYKHQFVWFSFFFFHKIEIHRWKVERTSFFLMNRNIFLPFQLFFSCEVSAKFLFVVQNCC